MMRRLSLDLVKSPTPAWPGMLVLAIAIAGALLCYWQYLGVSEHNATLESELAQLAAASRKLHAAQQPSALSSAELEAESRRAQEIASSLLLPWRDLFAALESASHSDVALLAIEPDHKKRQVRITAEARDFDILVEYLKRLGDAPQLELVRLLRYEVREDDKQRPLRFSVEASWKLPS